MEFLKILLFLLGLFSIGMGSELIEMSLNNSESLINSAEYSFLLFYTNWCHHCKIIIDEVIKVTIHYQEHKKTSIIFVKINGVFEKDLLEKYDIGEYPTIKFLINKIPYDFTGGRTSKEIIEWIEAKTKPTTIEITGIDQMNNMIKTNQFFVSYIGKNNSKFDKFLHVSRIIDGEAFFHSFNEELTELFYKNKEFSGIIIFRNFQEMRVNYEGDLYSAAQIIDFINENKFATIENFSPKIAEKVFGESTNCLFLFLDETLKSKNAFESFQKASLHLKEKIMMIIVRYPNSLNERLGDFLGVNRSQLPTVNFSICF